MIQVPQDGKLLLYGPALINVESTPVMDDDYFAIAPLRSYMTKMMRLYKGAGLAAPQVGVFKQYIIYDNGVGGVGELINPDITAMHGKETMRLEGCLSLPPEGNFCMVPRMEEIVVEHQPVADWRDSKSIVFRSQLSAVVQHEMDHLTGTFFIDRVGESARRGILEEFNKWKKGRLRNATKINSGQLTAIV